MWSVAEEVPRADIANASGLMRMTWESHGVRIEVRANSPRFWDDVLASLPPGTRARSAAEPDLEYVIHWADGGGPAAVHTLDVGAERAIRTGDAPTLMWALQNDIEWRLAAAARTGGFVHAGAVAVNGAGVVLPGVSGSGKSTLVSQLLRLGAVYYSDEYAVIDGAGLLHPFPCLLKIKTGQPDSWRVVPEAFGATTGEIPVPVALVAFPTYVPDAPLETESLTSGQTALQLLQNMPAARDNPAQTLPIAATLAGKTYGIMLRYGDGAEAAKQIVHLVRSRERTGDIA